MTKRFSYADLASADLLVEALDESAPARTGHQGGFRICGSRLHQS